MIKRFMEFLGKEREVKTIQPIMCEVPECPKRAKNYVQFKDGLWAYICDDHIKNIKRVNHYTWGIPDYVKDQVKR